MQFTTNATLVIFTAFTLASLCADAKEVIPIYSTIIVNDSPDVSVKPKKELDGCNQTITGKLRVGDSYVFSNDLANNTTKDLFVNMIRTTFTPKDAFGQAPAFSESKSVANSHIFKPSETARVLESTSFSIVKAPQKRSVDNIIISHQSFYSLGENMKWGSGQAHVTCIGYEITWCGDGVLDADQNEQCDPLDVAQSNWGAIGCTSKCKQIK